MSKKKKGKEVSLQIYARVRGLMPWEPKKVSLSVVGKTVQNKSGKIVNQYDFKCVFKPNSTNEQCFQVIAMPMIGNVLKGFNAVLIAYGQTGAGKTFSMLGKPKLNIVGILPMTLSYICKQRKVSKVELSAVEAFGHHVAKIFLFDLFDEKNQVPEWPKKHGITTIDPKKANRVVITDEHDAHSRIIYAHAGSHFAPTGKNPESSRGHVTFVATVHQETEPNMLQTSYFVMVDCAGSEGETAFTKEFRSRVTPQVLLCRRLEAGTINTGLSQLQVIFNELRLKGKLTNTLGNGLRRVLHPFINTKTFLSVLFALSPSVNNAKATESTLKFAVTAGMVKVKPVLSKGKVNFKTLSVELQAHIEKQEKFIDENNMQIEALSRQQNRIRNEIELAKSGGGKKAGGAGGGGDEAIEQKVEETMEKKTRKVHKMVDGEEVSEDEEYYVDESGIEIENVDEYKKQKADELGGGAIEASNLDDQENDAMAEVLSGLNDKEQEFMKGLGNDFIDMMTDKSLSSDKNQNITARKGRQRTVTMEENDEAMKVAMEQYSKLTIPWQKERFLKRTKSGLLKKQKEKEEQKKQEEQKEHLAEMEEQLKKSQEEMNRIKEKQAAIQEKLKDPNFTPQKEELQDHAVDLSIMLAEQKCLTDNLKQSKEVIIQFLKDDGREALIGFFKVKKIMG